MRCNIVTFLHQFLRLFGTIAPLFWAQRHFFQRSFLATVACIAFGVLVFGFAPQKAAAQVEVDTPGFGRVSTRVTVANGVLGVTNSYLRTRGVARECLGACFYASTTKTKNWVCPTSECNLDCSGREPIGGC